MIKKIGKFYAKCTLKMPVDLRAKHIIFSDAQLDELRHSLENDYFVGWRSKEKMVDAEYVKDLNAHLMGRLWGDRYRLVPWLNALCSLNGREILEIGCGTGSSTLALAEQGALVTGVDIDDGALQVAKRRLNIANLEANFINLNVTDLSKNFSSERFDFVIFFASLEHMVSAERLSGLRQAWELMKPGGLLVVIETPNRLWYQDQHTSLLPFFHWLPDDLAFQYSRFSGRRNFREVYSDMSEVAMLHFLRRGRGVSYHEFELALQPLSVLKVVTGLNEFEGMDFVKFNKMERRYMAFLSKLAPDIPKSFLYPYLDVAILKPSNC